MDGKALDDGQVNWFLLTDFMLKYNVKAFHYSFIQCFSTGVPQTHCALKCSQVYTKLTEE